MSDVTKVTRSVTQGGFRVTVCRECGHPLATEANDDPYGIADLLRGKQRKVFDMISKAGTQGVPTQAIFTRLYLDHPDGGPRAGLEIIRVFIRTVNLKIRRRGLVIRGHRTDGWKLVKA